jgi:hypothetical protein
MLHNSVSLALCFQIKFIKNALRHHAPL